MVTAYIAPDVLLRAILTKDTNSNKLLEIARYGLMITSGHAIWEVLASLTPEEIKEHAEKISQIVLHIDVVNPVGTGVVKMTPERRQHLREVAKNEVPKNP